MGKDFFSTGDSDEDDEHVNNNIDDDQHDQQTDDFPQVNSDDRIRRKLMKRHTKQINRLRKIEVRMQRATFRNENDNMASARLAWEAFIEELRNDPHSILNWNEDNASLVEDVPFQSINCQLDQKPEFRHLQYESIRSLEQQETPNFRVACQWIKTIREDIVNHMLEAHEQKNNNSDNLPNDMASYATARDTNHSVKDPNHLTSKEKQTLRARELKFHMHKGTQTASMFEHDDLALLGYTRQKFYERAALAFSALDRLDPCYSEKDDVDDAGSPAIAGDEIGNDRISLRKNIWERLLSTKEVVSIGCGPGCDAIGVLSFLHYIHGVPLKGMVLMDFVIDVWNELVLKNSLIPRIVPKYVPSVKTVSCDVTEPLLPNNDGHCGANSAAHITLMSQGGMVGHHKLVVVSYLLTETRGKWKAFFRDLLVLLRGTQSLLLLTEPNAWKLHEFLQCFGMSDTKDNLLIQSHVWLDSSRDLPHLQTLDTRSGPAALLVVPN